MERKVRIDFKIGRRRELVVEVDGVDVSTICHGIRFAAADSAHAAAAEFDYFRTNEGGSFFVDEATSDVAEGRASTERPETIDDLVAAATRALARRLVAR